MKIDQPTTGSGGSSPSIGGTVTSGTTGSVLFINPTATLSQDNNNFYFQDNNTTPSVLATNTNVAHSINVSGDFTGTDAMNIYGQYDAFLLNSQITNSLAGLNTDGAFPGFTSSSTRGTAVSIAQLQANDMVGGYFGFGTQGASSPTYQNLGGMGIFTTGASPNNLGGELRFYSKSDGGSLIQGLALNNSQVLVATKTTPTAATVYDAYWLNNTTAATVGAQQYSGAIHFTGQGWKTNATAASQSVDIREYLVPTQGTTAPGGALTWDVSVNGGAYTTILTVDGLGNITTPNGNIQSTTGTLFGAGALIGGNVTIGNGTISSSNATTSSSFNVVNSIGANTQSVSQYQFASSTTNFLRTAFYGSFSQTLTTGANYSSVLFGNAPITTFSSGTHPWLANVVVRPLGTVTAGGAAITNTATFYIDGASSAGTNNYALYVASGNTNLANGNLSLSTAGNKINIATGTNASVGTATLVGGTVTVSTTAVTANSKIFLTDATTGALTNIGTPTVGTIVAGTSFVINSSNVLDTSNINWFIMN